MKNLFIKLLFLVLANGLFLQSVFCQNPESANSNLSAPGLLGNNVQPNSELLLVDPNTCSTSAGQVLTYPATVNGVAVSLVKTGDVIGAIIAETFCGITEAVGLPFAGQS